MEEESKQTRANYRQSRNDGQNATEIDAQRDHHIAPQDDVHRRSRHGVSFTGQGIHTSSVGGSSPSFEVAHASSLRYHDKDAFSGGPEQRLMEDVGVSTVHPSALSRVASQFAGYQSAAQYHYSDTRVPTRPPSLPTAAPTPSYSPPPSSARPQNLVFAAGSPHLSYLDSDGPLTPTSAPSPPTTSWNDLHSIHSGDHAPGTRAVVSQVSQTESAMELDDNATVASTSNRGRRECNRIGITRRLARRPPVRTGSVISLTDASSSSHTAIPASRDPVIVIPSDDSTEDTSNVSRIATASDRPRRKRQSRRHRFILESSTDDDDITLDRLSGRPTIESKKVTARKNNAYILLPRMIHVMSSRKSRLRGAQPIFVVPSREVKGKERESLSPDNFADNYSAFELQRIMERANEVNAHLYDEEEISHTAGPSRATSRSRTGTTYSEVSCALEYEEFLNASFTNNEGLVLDDGSRLIFFEDTESTPEFSRGMNKVMAYSLSCLGITEGNIESKLARLSARRVVGAEFISRIILEHLPAKTQVSEFPGGHVQTASDISHIHPQASVTHTDSSIGLRASPAPSFTFSLLHARTVKRPAPRLLISRRFGVGKHAHPDGPMLCPTSDEETYHDRATAMSTSSVNTSLVDKTLRRAPRYREAKSSRLGESSFDGGRSEPPESEMQLDSSSVMATIDPSVLNTSRSPEDETEVVDIGTDDDRDDRLSLHRPRSSSREVPISSMLSRSTQTAQPSIGSHPLNSVHYTESDDDYSPTAVRTRRKASPAKPHGRGSGFRNRPEKRQVWPDGTMEHFCHQCRRRTTRRFMRCAMLRPSGRPCGLFYCEACVVTRYPKIAFNSFDLNFICPACEDVCNCSVCAPKRGEQYVSMRRRLPPLPLSQSSMRISTIESARSPSPDPLHTSRSLSPLPPLPSNARIRLPQGALGTIYGNNSEVYGEATLGETLVVRLLKTAILEVAAKAPLTKSSSHRWEYIGSPRKVWKKKGILTFSVVDSVKSRTRGAYVGKKRTYQYDLLESDGTPAPMTRSPPSSPVARASSPLMESPVDSCWPNDYSSPYTPVTPTLSNQTIQDLFNLLQAGHLNVEDL